MIIQWIGSVAEKSNFEISLPLSFTSRTSYIVVSAEGVGNCETRTTKDDDSGYDAGVGIDQKYENKIVVTVVFNSARRKVFLLCIGY